MMNNNVIGVVRNMPHIAVSLSLQNAISGHIASVCRSKQPQLAKGNIHNVSQGNEADELGIYSLYSIETVSYKPNKYTIKMFINGVCV